MVEPTYEAIKRRLMTGVWPAGARLESARLADALGVSVTPVRDSLYRLTGEHMVDFTHGEGFHVHRLTETELRDLLELNLILLLAALATRRGGIVDRASPAAEETDRIGALFLGVASRSGNAELAAAIASLNDRLHLTRRLDRHLFADAEAEGAAIEAALFEAGPPAIARNLILRYHERRAQEAASYVRMLAERRADR
ncbi:GntR family transcriptional regulator [Novosphingobium resinovorum]|uniref:GntR family transcriptional regulator n=1 Tax=Novosphingobium resinovorum TaxID=158500 RepID=UPI00138E1985|nr:GntR family transcriptional regulator [Novosphingobium resinovorum]